MSHRIEDKQARRAERMRLEEQARHAEARQRLLRRAGYAAVGLIAVTLVTVAVGGGGGGGKTAAPADHMGAAGTGSAVGDKAPAFTLTDVVSDRRVSLASLAGRKTLMFFSEGVNCQACMVQAADLQKSRTLTAAGIRLVSVTTDPPDQLAQAAAQYGITSMLLADPSTEMSKAYGMLGHGGMGHAMQDGHAFMLLDGKGKVLWHQAYQEMYVKPHRLMKDMGMTA